MRLYWVYPSNATILYFLNLGDLKAPAILLNQTVDLKALMWTLSGHTSFFGEFIFINS